MLRHHSISKIAASQARGHNKEPHISICFRKKTKQPLVFLRAMMRVKNRRGKSCVSKGKRKDSISGASMEYIIVNQAEQSRWL